MLFHLHKKIEQDHNRRSLVPGFDFAAEDLTDDDDDDDDDDVERQSTPATLREESTFDFRHWIKFFSRFEFLIFFSSHSQQ